MANVDSPPIVPTRAREPSYVYWYRTVMCSVALVAAAALVFSAQKYIDDEVPQFWNTSSGEFLARVGDVPHLREREPSADDKKTLSIMVTAIQFGSVAAFTVIGIFFTWQHAPVFAQQLESSDIKKRKRILFIEGMVVISLVTCCTICTSTILLFRLVGIVAVVLWYFRLGIQRNLQNPEVFKWPRNQYSIVAWLGIFFAIVLGVFADKELASVVIFAGLSVAPALVALYSLVVRTLELGPPSLSRRPVQGDPLPNT